MYCSSKLASKLTPLQSSAQDPTDLLVYKRRTEETNTKQGKERCQMAFLCHLTFFQSFTIPSSFMLIFFLATFHFPIISVTFSQQLSTLSFSMLNFPALFHLIIFHVKCSKSVFFQRKGKTINTVAGKRKKTIRHKQITRHGKERQQIGINRSRDRGKERQQIRLQTRIPIQQNAGISPHLAAT